MIFEECGKNGVSIPAAFVVCMGVMPGTADGARGNGTRFLNRFEAYRFEP